VNQVAVGCTFSYNVDSVHQSRRNSRHWRRLFNVLGLAMVAGLFVASTAGAGTRAYVLAGNNTLVAIDITNAAATSGPIPIVGMNAGDVLVGIDFRPQNGMLYGLGFNSVAGTVRLYAISHRTGQAAPVGATGTFTDPGSNPMPIIGPEFGFEFSPGDDRVRVVTSAGLNFRIDPNSGAFVDGNLGGPPNSVAGLNMDAFVNAQTNAAAYTNSRQNPTATTLFTLSAASDTMHIVNPATGVAGSPKVVTLGGNTLDFASISGFDILPDVQSFINNGPATGVGYAALMVGGTTSLYTIDLGNGTATLVGPIANGPVHGLALQGEAVPNGLPAVAHTVGNQLVRFNTGAAYLPGFTPVAGLTAGESIVAIDWRPWTGQLFGLGFNPAAGTGAATLYLLDPQTGAATAVGVASGIADGAGNPISLAGASSFGFDFDPTTDRIRIVTNNGLNFRVNPTTGAPVLPIDTNISGLPPGSSGLAAAAYTNSYGHTVGAGATTLYAIDAAADRLFIQNPADGGILTQGVGMTIGGAPLNLSNVTAFDIPPDVSVNSSHSAAFGRGFVTEEQSGDSALLAFDLATGMVTTVSPLPFGGVVSGLAVGDGPHESTGTSLVSSVNPAAVGEAVTFTATISRATAGGTVAFTNLGVPIAGCATQPIAAGVATCTTTFATPGMSFIAADYSGDDTHWPSTSATLTQNVSVLPTATTMVTSMNPVNVGQEVTFTATLTPSAADGIVVFTRNTQPIPGCDGQPVVAGTAICTTTFFVGGNATIVAEYGGSPTYAPSHSAPLALELNKQATTTVMTVTPTSSSPFRKPVTLTARVSPAGQEGEVIFKSGPDVAAVMPLGLSEEAPGDPLTRIVSITVSNLALGTHSLTATFSGDDIYEGSVSAPITLTVEDTEPLTQYFAEGATGDFFHTEIGILNASKTHAASVEVKLFPESGPPIVEQFDLQPLTRRSVDVNALLGSGQGVSALVKSTQPVAAMRQITWGTPVYGSTLEGGISWPSTTWYFAEGATNVFSLFYLIQNPTSSEASVTLRHLVEGGAAPIDQVVTVPAASRRTFFINEVPGLEAAALSTVITSNVQIVAERAMYLNTPQPLGSGAASRGARELGTSWSLAEGATGFFHTYLLLGNPNADTAAVTVRYQLPDGTAFDKTYDVPGLSRRTVDVNFEDARLASTAVGMSITSTLPIVSERAMWWGEPFVEGSVAIGSSATGTVWAIGEGAEGGALDESTFVLVSNGTLADGTVKFTVVYDDGTNESVDYTVPGEGRLTVRIFDDFVKARNAKFSVLVESVTTGVPIAVEVARYQSGGSFLGAGGAAQATRIQ
jgi:hypothetical protein